MYFWGLLLPLQKEISKAKLLRLMNKFIYKRLLPMALILLSGSSIHAEEMPGNDAIYAWVDGSSTCYKLEKMPKVTYSADAAVLTVDGHPVMEVPLADGGKLKITYGVYQEPTGITNATDSKVTQSGKYIIGGQLVIIKGEKWYDINGRELKH